MSFSFGAPAATAPAASGFNFGSTTTAPAPATGSSFNFGNANAASQTQAPATGGGFNFGAAPAAATTTAPATSAFNFGAAPQAQQPATTTSAFNFGQSTSHQPAKPPLFGQAPSPTGTTTNSFGGFGAATQPAASTSAFSGFGQPPAAASTSAFSGFGAAANAPPSGSSVFGIAPVATPASAPIVCGADAAVAQLNTIKAAYDDPMQSRFKFLLYNAVDPTQRHLYTRPAHISDRQWTQAELDNPDPLHFAPAPLVGFDDLLKRIAVQQQHATTCDTYVGNLRDQLSEMATATRATDEKLAKCRHEHVQLFHTLVKVMKDIELLQSVGKPLNRNELELAMHLKKLQSLLNAPAQYKARLHDAVARQRLQKSAVSASASANATQQQQQQLHPDDLQRLYQFLDQQRQGLEHLTNILNDDLADMKLIKETWRR